MLEGTGCDGEEEAQREEFGDPADKIVGSCGTGTGNREAGLPGACIMLFPPGKMVLPWALLLLLLDCQLLVTPFSYRQEKFEQNDQNSMFEYFPPTLEFAVYKFNLLSKDKYAYRVLNVLNAKQEGDSPVVFSMRVTLGRTKCRKFEENLDNCPLYEVPGLINTIVCYFVVSTNPWKTEFGLLKNSCSE